MARKSDRTKLVEHVVASWPLDEAPKHVSVIVHELAIVILAKSDDEAAEFADQHSYAVLSALQIEYERTVNDRGFNRFSFNSASEEHIQGSSFVQPNEEGLPIAEAKRRRLEYDGYAAFLRGLSWREFEGCCRGILRQLGCSDPQMTSQGNDQGVDFFGQLSLEGRLDNFSELPGFDSKLQVWMVGQAKHYTKTQVSTPDLRELVGSVRLARAKVFADEGRALAGFTPRVCDPVFYVFFTTGSISADGVTLLRESGMVSMDGAQIAVFLSDNGVGTLNDKFDQPTAQSWIDSLLEP